MKKDYSFKKYVKLMQRVYDVLEPDCREMTDAQLTALEKECRRATRKASVVEFKTAEIIIDWIEFVRAVRALSGK